MIHSFAVGDPEWDRLQNTNTPFLASQAAGRKAGRALFVFTTLLKRYASLGSLAFELAFRPQLAGSVKNNNCFQGLPRRGDPGTCTQIGLHVITLVRFMRGFR